MATPIVNVILEKNGKILMLKRNFYPEGKLDLLGGFVDKDETIEQAAIREAKEESGFDVRLLRKLGEYDYFDRGNKTMHAFLGEIIGGKLTHSEEGIPMWIEPKSIRKEDLAFPQVHVRILGDYTRIRNSL